jgi:hypothetical protein
MRSARIKRSESAMKRVSAVLFAFICCVVCSVRGDYSVEDQGAWPDTWPDELDGLRPQARTLEGPLRPQLHYAIPFTSREEFEAAWPHLLKVVSPGAPITLRRGPNFWLEGDVAGVCVHCPPADTERIGKVLPRTNNSPEPQISIELIVDGDIVDLNRIPLPPDTPIVDERFKE